MQNYCLLIMYCIYLPKFEISGTLAFINQRPLSFAVRFFFYVLNNLRVLAAHNFINEEHTIDQSELRVYIKPIPPVYRDRFLLKVRNCFRFYSS